MPSLVVLETRVRFLPCFMKGGVMCLGPSLHPIDDVEIRPSLDLGSAFLLFMGSGRVSTQSRPVQCALVFVFKSQLGRTHKS